MICDFDKIRPFSELETLEAVKRLFTDDGFLTFLSYFKDKIDIDEWVKEVLACKTQFDFHLAFADRVFHYFIKKSCSSIHFSGIENINLKTPHLFIGNHRDIILDSSFLQIFFFKNKVPATRTAIGDNLVANQLFGVLARIHKMFLVLRSGTKNEKIANTHLLSSYIYQSLFEEKESVWIAQGNGRTKNGDDKTQKGLLKMLTLAAPDKAMQILKQMKLTPVSISYQYEPCALLKARELALSESTRYFKQSGEDTNSIIQGITGFKGEVHFVIGNPIQNEIDSIPQDLSLNEKLMYLCKLIDDQIYQNYFLYLQNYIAFDIQENNDRFSSYYSQEEKEAFIKYLDTQSHVEDVSKEKMMKYLLDIYANPVRNRLKI